MHIGLQACLMFRIIHAIVKQLKDELKMDHNIALSILIAYASKRTCQVYTLNAAFSFLIFSFNTINIVLITIEMISVMWT